MSYDALRRGRYSLHHQVYCITTVTRDRRPLFTDITTARLLIRELRRLHEQGAVVSLAWVVMPDHLHWLIRLGSSLSNEFGFTAGSLGIGRMNSTLQAFPPDEFGPTGLSRVVKALKARSAIAINRYLCRHGNLWQRAYYDRAARKHEDIRQIARYIVANPLRAGLVRDIGDYPHWDCIWMADGDGMAGVD